MSANAEFQPFEEIIKLTDIEQDTRESLKVLLIGQNEFNDAVLKKNNSGVGSAHLHQLCHRASEPI